MEYDFCGIGSFAVSSLSVSIDLVLKSFTRYSPNHPITEAPFILPSPLPRPVPKVKLPPTPMTPPRTSTKRPLPVELADGVLDLDPTPKKPKLAVGESKRKHEDNPSPSKRRRLEDEGLVLMDGPDEVLDTGDVMEVSDRDYIVIDGD
jgi:ubiquitin-like 1-activating enzyme E1 B